MTTDRCLAALAMAIVALLGTSCANGEEPLSPPTANAAPSSMPELTQEVSAIPTPSPPAATSSEPTSEPIPTIAEIEATTEDEQSVIDTATSYYEDVYVELLSNPEADREQIVGWVSGQAMDRAQTQIDLTRSLNERLTGQISLGVLSVVVQGDSAAVIGCFDDSDADLVDEDGESVLPEGRVPEILEITLTEQQASPFGWVISDVASRGVPCIEWQPSD